MNSLSDNYNVGSIHEKSDQTFNNAFWDFLLVLAFSFRCFLDRTNDGLV